MTIIAHPHRQRFIFLRFLTDMFLIPVVVISAYSLKFKVGWIAQRIFWIHFGRIYHHAQIEPYIHALTLVVGVWLFSFYVCGMYKSFTGLMPDVDELISIVSGVTLGSILVTIASFLFNFFPESRTVLIYSWGIGIGAISIARLIISRAEKTAISRGIGVYQTAIIGNTSQAQDIAERMILFPTYRLKFSGFIADSLPDTIHFNLRRHADCLGPISDWKSILMRHQIQVLYVATHMPDPVIKEIDEFCRTKNITLNFWIDFPLRGHEKIQDFDGLPFIQSPPILPFYPLHKRIFDLICALTLLVILSPVLFGIGILIKIVSPNGPIFYTQDRKTLGDQTFGMIKFRTMVPDAETKSGPIMVDEKNESRCIKFGQFLRKTSLDELPQLFNVILGQMSLVGPRPERPFFIDQFSTSIPQFSWRHQMPGGITGWAQINGRSVLTRRPEHKIKYDLYYIRNWSFLFDIKIILKTVLVVLNREEAY